MSNGIKNLQAAARHSARRERAESSGATTSHNGYGGPADDDSGISGIGLTPVDDLDASYSSPETSASSSHRSVASAPSASSHHHQHQHTTSASSSFQHHPAAMLPSYYSGHSNGGYGAYSSSLPSAATTASYHHPQHHGHHHHEYSQRLPSVSSVDMGIDAIINRGH